MFRKAIAYGGMLGLLLSVIGLVLYVTSLVWDTISLSFTFIGLALFMAFVLVRFDLVQSVFGTRKFRYGTTATIHVLIVLGILTAINFIGSRHEKRFDLTEGAYYSLSSQTKKVIDNLEDELIITAFSKSGSRKQIEDLLTEYVSRSDKIKYKIVDGDENPLLARSYNVSQYPTTVIEAGGRRQVINRHTEEVLTNAIVKVTRKKEKVIYFLDGHGEKDIESIEPDEYSLVKEMLEKENYVIKKLPLAIDGAVPEDCVVLVVAGPKYKLFENEEELIDNFLSQAGKVMVLVDPEPSAGLNLFLGSWGVQVGNDLVVDKSSVGTFFGAGPAVPIANDYNRNHPITKDISVISLFPQARSISISDSRDRRIIANELVRTSQHSYGETNLLSGNRSVYNEDEDKIGPLALGVVVTKEWKKASQAGDTENNSTLVVFGDSDFASNQYFGLAGNGDLFLNAINWLAEEEDLIAIRPRNPEDRRVILNNQQLVRIFFVVVVAMPLVAAFSGIVVWWRRRKK